MTVAVRRQGCIRGAIMAALIVLLHILSVVSEVELPKEYQDKKWKKTIRVKERRLLR